MKPANRNTAPKKAKCELCGDTGKCQVPVVDQPYPFVTVDCHCTAMDDFPEPTVVVAADENAMCIDWDVVF